VGAAAWLAIALSVLSVSSSLGGLDAAGPVQALSGPFSPSAASLPRIGDDGTTTLFVAGASASVLTDRVSLVTANSHLREYSIHLTASISMPNVNLLLTTQPLVQWGEPLQLPGGVDALPPLAEWNWTVHAGSWNDTSNWTVVNTTQSLTRITPWVNSSFTVLGSTRPLLQIDVQDSAIPGRFAPSTGFVADGIYSPASNTSGDPTFPALAGSVDPGVIRIGMTTTHVPVVWNNTSASPVFGWGIFDQVVNLTHSLHADAYLSLPAGTWGDGNTLPAGMPVNTSLPVPFENGTGYFPTPRAYAAYAGAIAAHVLADHLNVTYWNVGNEVPRINATEVAAYIRVFNAGERAIHSVLPNALVGSDVMMDPEYILQFARTARGVGFLSFHYYAAWGTCLENGTYCPPGGGAKGTEDPTIMAADAGLSDLKNWVAPTVAQMIWFNVTHQELPVLDSESNLNHEGGEYTSSVGTDPRIQTLFGAAWLTRLFIQGTLENLSSILYYTFTGPSVILPSSTSADGGWGFQMTREGPNGQHILYAPYWAMRLWAEGVPAGAPALQTLGGEPGVGEAQAFQNGSGVSIILVNEVNATTHFMVSMNGTSYTPTSITVLDRRSYVELYDRRTGSEVLVRSGVASVDRLTSPVNVYLRGYGMALITAVPTTDLPRDQDGAASSTPAPQARGPLLLPFDPGAVPPRGLTLPFPVGPGPQPTVIAIVSLSSDGTIAPPGSRRGMPIRPRARRDGTRDTSYS
jgi:hypothetical protein